MLADAACCCWCTSSAAAPLTGASDVPQNPEFFSKFSCVVATDLADPQLAKLAALLWEKEIPLMVGRAYGMIGTWRNVFPQAHRSTSFTRAANRI